MSTLLGIYIGGLFVCIMWRITDLEYADFEYEDVPMILLWPLTMLWMLYNLVRHNL